MDIYEEHENVIKRCKNLENQIIKQEALLRKAVETMNEMLEDFEKASDMLSEALLKYRHAGKNNEYNLRECENNIIEEIADVEICLEYPIIAHSLTRPDFREEIERVKEYKLKRMIKRKDEEV